MKKALLLILTIAALISGCGGAARMPANEPVTGSFAYVTGKYGVFGQEILFQRVGERNGSDEVRITSSDGYPIFKVQPGRYMCTATFKNGGRVTGRLAEFTAEAGKITYVGDFELEITSYKMPTMAKIGKARAGGASPEPLRIQTVISNADNSGKAKAAIRQNYPALAGNLDALFVYRPVTPSK